MALKKSIDEQARVTSQTVSKMQEFIKAHLHEQITSGDIAKSVGYSQFHAARMFKTETGLSPFEYIRRLRLTGSAYALRKSETKVFDVALDFVFDSHEGFTRAFTNAFGITPKKFAVHPDPKGWLIPYCYLDRHKIQTEDLKMEEGKEKGKGKEKENKNEMKKTAVIFTQIIERPARKLILFRSKKATHYFEYVEETGCGTPEKPAPWDILCNIKEALYEPVGVWLPDNMRPEGTGVYAHAVEVAVDYAGEIPDGFDVIDLEPCKYLIFQGEPYDDEVFEEEVGACMDRIDEFNPKVYGYEYDDRIAPKFQLAPMGWRGYIEGRPVREIK